MKISVGYRAAGNVGVGPTPLAELSSRGPHVAIPSTLLPHLDSNQKPFD